VRPWNTPGRTTLYRPASDGVVLFCRDARLAADDEVSLAYGPLVPPLERDLKAVAERPGDRLGLSPRDVA